MEVFAEIGGDAGIADIIGRGDRGPGILGRVGASLEGTRDLDAASIGVIHLTDIIGVPVVIRVEFDEEIVNFATFDDLL